MNENAVSGVPTLLREHITSPNKFGSRNHHSSEEESHHENRNRLCSRLAG